ncbi:MAG: F0F1 ATP synthase subunit alpha [Lachnospiraceae bacterium]|nr:F0F1 ATP synthase subunit alpha [Lachnospiraceae bacterium]
MTMDEKMTAVLYSSEKPSDKDLKRLADFLLKKYDEPVSIGWKNTPEVTGGFRLVVGGDVYDWNKQGRLRQLQDALLALREEREDIIPLIKDTLINWTPTVMVNEIGKVTSVGDGIATVSGLEDTSYGEILLFSGGVRGMALDLRRDETACILFDAEEEVCEGSTVKRTGRVAGVPVGEGFLGRVVDPLGVPVDGLEDILADDYRPVESEAPAVIDRQPVNVPLETGILAIDSMFPIGRGQRELIIGDRQTGKSTIITDTILNQKGKDVICIYVAIGQKTSTVARLVDTLKKNGAMEYTIVVNASAAESAPLQYIAPYAGCAMGEYFMEKGKDVLIVYDDLTKHAIAYRSISLLLERAPGREAYPGDVFYLHSRLLERSARLSNEKGGGSLTALPVIETQEEDVSSYIPTNVISITDGQIFLSGGLFRLGQRPAINVGLSVSRVGGDAQTKAMKKAVGTLRLDLAQYREMETFSQFAGDMDEATRKQIKYGEGLMKILKQKQNRPLSLPEQVFMLVIATTDRFEHFDIEGIEDRIRDIARVAMKSCQDIVMRIENAGVIDDADKKRIVEAAIRANG